MRVLVIIPAYNEEDNLPNLLNKLERVNELFDILVINDCSTDNTLAVCNRLGVKVINLPVNLGIGGAVQTGYKYALENGYDFAIQIDGDGQHNPEYIELLMREVKNGVNMCIGSRFINKQGFQSTFMRRIGINYFSKIIKFFTGQIITDPTSGFRVVDKNILKIFSHNYPSDYPEPESIVMVKKHNFKVSEVPVIMNNREAGASSITSYRSIYYMVKVTLAILFASLESNNRS